MQLVELQNAWPTLEQQGVALFGVSYDGVETLAEFAQKRGITFPLLADNGSHVIRELGLLNEHLAQQHAVYGIVTRDFQHGVAYPGTFVLNEQGVIVEKHFEQSYRVRPNAQLFRAYAFGASGDMPSHAVRASAPGVEISAWVDVPTYRPYQQLQLHIELELPPGMRVYGEPVSQGYMPLRLQVEPLEGLTTGQIDMPAPRPFHVAGLDERFLVYTGSVRMTLPIMFTSNLGATTLVAELAFQTCTDTTCFPPASVRVELPLIGLDLIRD